MPHLFTEKNWFSSEIKNPLYFILFWLPTLSLIGEKCGKIKGIIIIAFFPGRSKRFEIHGGPCTPPMRAM